jgi:hypothetical protein
MTLQEHVHPSARTVTDEFPAYTRAVAGFAGHEHVKHGAGHEVNECGFHANTVESYFPFLKRGVYGTFPHISKKHLHYCCDEFSFRWGDRNVNDRERCEQAIRGIEHKRLPYNGLVRRP